MKRQKQLVEIRIVENELGMRPDIQYRYKLPIPTNGCITPPYWDEWSEWKTAPYVKEEDT